MTVVGPKTIESAKAMMEQLLKSYDKEIEKAYLAAEKAFSVSFKLKIEPGGHRTLHLEMSLEFVAERVKDKTSRSVTEGQMSLDFKSKKVTSCTIPHEILFRKFNWPYPHPIYKPEKQAVKVYKAPPFFKRGTKDIKRKRALLLKKFDLEPMKQAA